MLFPDCGINAVDFHANLTHGQIPFNSNYGQFQRFMEQFNSQPANRFAEPAPFGGPLFHRPGQYFATSM